MIFLMLLLALGGLAGGCARLPERPVSRMPAPESAAALWTHLQEKAAKVPSIQARGQFFLLSPARNYQGNAQLQLRQPDHLRLEVLNFWGQSLVTFLSDGVDLKFMVYPEGKLYRGPATTANFQRFVPLSLTLADFLAVLTGQIAGAAYEAPHWEADPDPEAYKLILTRKDGGGTVELRVAPDHLGLVAAVWRNPEGGELLRATWAEYQEQDGLWLPREVQLASPEGRYRLRWRYRDLKAGIPIAPAAWELPHGPEIQELPFPQ